MRSAPRRGTLGTTFSGGLCERGQIVPKQSSLWVPACWSHFGWAGQIPVVAFTEKSVDQHCQLCRTSEICAIPVKQRHAEKLEPARLAPDTA